MFVCLFVCSFDCSNNGEVTDLQALWGWAERTASSNSSGVAYFACLSGRSYLPPGERSSQLYLEKKSVIQLSDHQQRRTAIKIDRHRRAGRQLACWTVYAQSTAAEVVSGRKTSHQRTGESGSQFKAHGKAMFKEASWEKTKLHDVELQPDQNGRIPGSRRSMQSYSLTYPRL